jgi:hypothetical protein
VRLLRRQRPPDLEKGGFHPEKQREVSLAELIRTMRGHEPNHAAQVEHHQAAGSIAALDNCREIVMSSGFVLAHPVDAVLGELRAKRKLSRQRACRNYPNPIHDSAS